MIVIGLAGSTRPSREAIAQRLCEEGRQGLVMLQMKGERLYTGRGRILARALEGIGPPLKGLVLPHVLSEEEAEVVRAHGGFVWHVYGVPSSDVRIRRGDLLVTRTEGGERHWLDPIEALSEALLRQGRAG